MTALLAKYRSRKNAPAETSLELRWLLFGGMAIAIIGLGITGGIFMLPFAAVALIILWFGHRYASRNCRAPSKWVKRGVFLAINFAFLYMMVGLAVGLPYPQGQMAMFGMALISWEMMNRGNMYAGWLFVLANLHVTATLSRGFFFFVPLLIAAGCFLAFMWVIEKLDAADAGYKPVAEPKPFWSSFKPSLNLATNKEMAPIFRWGASFGGMAFLVGIVAFIAIPRFAGTPLVPPFTLRVPMSGGAQGQIINPAVPLVQVEGVNNSEAGEYYHGFDSQLDLSYRGGLSTATMMYVRSPARSYWRSHAYDFYNGRSWVQSAGDAVTIVDKNIAEPSFMLTQDPPPGEQFTQTFYVVNDLPNIAFVGGSPVEIFIPAEQIAIDSTGGIRLGEVLESGMTYSVRSVATRYDPALLRLTGFDYPLDIRAKYLQLPDTVTQRTRDLAADLTAGHETAYDKAMAIQEHLLTSYPYDYFPPPQKPNSDSVDQFLFVDQTGYCEHYVSAMVIMLRSQGVPARLVSGFGSGQYDAINNLFEVRALDAHSWVEVYFPGYGWVPFEPTPGWTGSPDISNINTWILGGAMSAIDLPAIPFGAIGSAVATVFSVTLTPVLIIGLLVGLWFAGRWAWQRYQDYLATRPPVYTKLQDLDQQPSRGQVLTHYRKVQKQRDALRDPEQTTQEHADIYTDFDELADLVDIAAYRPEPPTDEELNKVLE